VIDLEVNAEKTKYMFLSPDQNAGQSHNIKTSNKPSERVELFKYFGTTLTYKNPIHAEIKIQLKTGNACYQTKIHKTNFACCFVGVWFGLLHWGRNRGWGCLRTGCFIVYCLLSKIFGPKGVSVAERLRRLDNKQLFTYSAHQITSR